MSNPGIAIWLRKKNMEQALAKNPKDQCLANMHYYGNKLPKNKAHKFNLIVNYLSKIDDESFWIKRCKWKFQDFAQEMINMRNRNNG